MILTHKQTIALDYLEDDTTTELLFGGGAGGGKSVLGVYWIVKQCLRYPGTRWVIGRAVLKTLKETTLKTFFEVTREQGLKMGQHFAFNATSNVITFFNGSEIFLKDLYLYPSDPNFDELGSLEITGAFVDECNQIVEKAWEVLKSRIRYKLDENNLIPKIMGSCNPSKNWVFRRFYIPYEQDNQKNGRRFVQSLAKDNKYISKHYIENLENLSDKASKERLLKGNWNYDDNPNSLCDRDSILAIFGGNIPEPSPKHYITADVARFGSDLAVILVWNGLSIVEYITFETSSTVDIQKAIMALRVKYKVPKDRVIVDDDGIGGGVTDNLQCIGFVNNSRPMENKESKEVENYANLQSQCGYKLAEKINAREVVFECDVPSEIQDNIAEELEQLQTWKADNDGKLRLKPKAEIKADIGRSPDWRDAMLMRMYFEYRDYQPANLSILSSFG